MPVVSSLLEKEYAAMRRDGYQANNCQKDSEEERNMEDMLLYIHVVASVSLIMIDARSHDTTFSPFFRLRSPRNN